MNRNELTVKVQKKINCYLFNAYYLCILLAYDNMYPWFYENYIQLYFNANKPVNFNDKKEVWLDFYGGWTEARKMLECEEKKKAFFYNVDIIKYIEDSIDSNTYVYTYIDEYYTKEFNKQHFTHDIFIYGYDNIKKELLVIGFDNNADFTNLTIGLDAFEKAFSSGLNLSRTFDEENNNCGINDFYCINIKMRYGLDYNYTFKPNNFMRNLNDYLYSIDSSKRESSSADVFDSYILPGNTFGINIYNDLLDYIKNEKTFLDYRPFHTLYEHKYSIYERMLYIQENYCLRNSKKYLREYGIVADAFNDIRLQVIKYNISKSDKLIDSIYSEIEQYKDIEREILTEFSNDFNLCFLNNKNNKY